jgi:site-specific DNA-methyltransferase (adenine-specific)
MKKLKEYKYLETNYGTLYNGEALEVLKLMPDESVNCIITSPPYWGLRDYGVDDQLGLEYNYQDYIKRLITIFDQCKRILKKDGTCWVNIGDTYSGNSSYSYKGRAGFEEKDGNVKDWVDPKLPARKRERDLVNTNEIKNKCLCQIPERFSIAMTDAGWILRNEIIWNKPNGMPSSVKDRFTVCHEKLYFFSKSKKYYFEQQFEPHLTKIGKLRNKNEENCYNGYVDGDRFSRGQRTMYGENGKNKRTVWDINTRPFSEVHFAVFPKKLIETPIKAGCPEGGIVVDPFAGSGTTLEVAEHLNRTWIGIELNPEYCEIGHKRLKADHIKFDFNKKLNKT